MGIIVQPTAYITWIPLGKITVEPTEAYITWLPFGSVEVTPKVCAAWVPLGKVSVKPMLCASIVPGSEKARADTSRNVSKPLTVTGDTLRRMGKPDNLSADTARNISRTETVNGDILRRVGETQTATADTKRRTYLPNGAFVTPSAYISWLPIGKVIVKPTDAYITWLPFGSIELTPQIAASWVPMGTITIKPMFAATYVPANRVVTVAADTNRRLSLPNDVAADTERKINCSNTAIADTKRQVQSPYIAWALGDLLRKLTYSNTTTADTRRTVSGEWAVIHADTQRITGDNYQVLRVDTWLGTGKTERIAFDTKRTPGIANIVSGDTFRLLGHGSPTKADAIRTVIKQERTPADTSIRVPLVLEYVNRSQPVRTKAKRLKAKVVSTPITQNFHDHGIRSFSMVLGELTLSDTFQLETSQPMNIDDAVQGQILDYHFHFLVEETSQRDLIQTVKGMYSKDDLLYTAINATVSELNVSFYARQIATALGLELNMVCDDFIPSQNFENAGMTYQDMISALFGWTSKLPQRQINVFIRGNILNIVQRGLEQSVIDISDWPHSRPTIERKLVRSIWHSNNNDDPDNQAHNEEDDAPIPFTGTISFEDISYTYDDGYLVREKNENGETTYSYQNEYDRDGNPTGKYVSCKQTQNKDGSVNEVDYVYAATANNIYLFKERERSREPKDTPSYKDEWDSERITYHAPIGYGWYATTVYEDGERVGSSLSQGAPGGKASQYTIDQSALGLGSHYSSYYGDGDSQYSSLIDTEFPVEGEEYLAILTQAIEWLNRKTQETATLEIHANIRDGVPDVEHIVDFTERIKFDGNEYFLVSNSVELNPRSLKQTIKMTRWY